MDEGIKISDQDVVSHDDIADGVAGLKIVFVNVYAVRGENGWVLIDTGLPLSSVRTLAWLKKQFGEGARPEAILLTHGHFDHSGGVKDLVEKWNVPVYAHPNEMPYLRGRKSYPKPDASAGGGAMSLMAPLYPTGPIDLGKSVQDLPADGSVPGLAMEVDRHSRAYGRPCVVLSRVGQDPDRRRCFCDHTVGVADGCSHPAPRTARATRFFHQRLGPGKVVGRKAGEA